MIAPIEVLIAGGGPAGLATAIRVKRNLAAAGRDGAVVVIDKALHAGYHTLSGAVFEPACLDELLPDWRDDKRFIEHVIPVEHDEMYFLTGGRAVKLPDFVVPPLMHHRNDVMLPVSRLVDFLAAKATSVGVELYYGYSARALVFEGDRVVGVALGELGLDAHETSKGNHRPPEEIRARVTVLADGSCGVLSSQFRDRFGGGPNPQVYSLGVKALVQFPSDNRFGSHRVVHTLGYPVPSGAFGGGFLYSMGERSVAVGLILGLDWAYGDLVLQQEFERFRSHPFIASLLEGSVPIATGAKTLPEGGYYALGTLASAGALVVGDGAGFTNVAKIKGLHYAILSGIAAADTIAEALESGDVSAPALQSYRARLESLGVLPDMRHARNYRASFRQGIYVGAPLSLVQSHLPLRLGMKRDSEGTRRGARLARADAGGMDGATFVSLTGALHREDEPAHMTILDPAKCVVCETDYANSCTHFCPGQVYRWDGAKIVLSPSNCLHCMTCAVKCPFENIQWLPPEGGEGPRFKHM